MKRRIVIIILIVVALAAAGLYFYRERTKKQSSAAFATAIVQRGYIAASVTATGTVEPVDTVSVGAQVSGVIKDVYADFNDQIKKGQLLAKVDPSIFNAQLEQVNATLSNAKSNLEYQRNNYDRQSKLFELGAISKADFQVAVNQYNSAKAAVENAIAQIKLSERNLYYTNIYSPINGIVLNRNVNQGQTIASNFNAPTLFVIAKDLTKMEVNAAVDEADIGGVKPSQHVSFTVDAFPDEVFDGTVNTIYLRPSVSANVVTYRTLIDVDNRAMKLKPGMTASINIYLQEDTNALLIPVKALNFKLDTLRIAGYQIKAGTKMRPNTGAINNKEVKSGSGWVWLRKGTTLEQRMVVTGINNGTAVEVLSGLQPADEVITGLLEKGQQEAQQTQHSPFRPSVRRPAGRTQ